MINIMLVDDHAILRQGLKRSFEDSDDIKVVGEAGSGAEMLKSLPKCRPQVVLLDINLPDANGPSLIQQIKKTVPGCKVVVLTMYGHVRYALDALAGGADGFVLKGSSYNELLGAVRAVARGKAYICTELAPELIGRINSPEKSGLASLSAREFEVLALIGRGMSLKEAGAQMGISEKTVGTYQTRLMEKLNLANRTDLVRLALQAGIIQ